MQKRKNSYYTLLILVAKGREAIMKVKERKGKENNSTKEQKQTK